VTTTYSRPQFCHIIETRVLSTDRPWNHAGQSAIGRTLVDAGGNCRWTIFGQSVCGSLSTMEAHSSVAVNVLSVMCCGSSDGSVDSKKTISFANSSGKYALTRVVCVISRRPHVAITLLKLLSTYISAENEEAHLKLPLSSVVFHHDRTSPIQYELFVAEVFSQLISWLLSDGRPMSEKNSQRSTTSQTLVTSTEPRQRR